MAVEDAPSGSGPIQEDRSRNGTAAYDAAPELYE